MLVSLLLCPGPVHGSQEYGFVSWVGVRASDGLIIFAISNYPHVPASTRTSKPACATAGYWVIRDENSTAGARQYEAVMKARFAVRTIAVYGTGTCTRWPDGEDADFVQVFDFE